MGRQILDHNGFVVTHGRERLDNGVRLHYYTSGSGPALVLQHGVPKTSYYWRKVVPRLTPHFTVVVPDMRGFGDSTHPDSGYDMASIADDIGELMTKLGHKRFHMCGEDWGAAAAYQEMLLPGMGLEEWATFNPQKPETHLWHVAFYYVRDVPELLITGREREYFTWFLKNEAYSPTAIDDDAIDEYVSKFAQPGGLRSMFNVYRATERNMVVNKKAAETKLKMPVLAVGSRAFIGQEVKNQMDKVAEQVEYRELNFGHQLAEECPDDLAKVYLGFLAA